MKKYNLLFLALLSFNSSYCQENTIFKNYLKALEPRSKIAAFTEQHHNDPKIFDYLLTADIKPYFYLFNKTKHNYSVSLVPRFYVRMINAPSFPVRTPSYMPGVVFDIKTHNNASNSKTTYNSFRFSFFHHSNGLDDGPNVNTSDDLEMDESKFFNRYDGGFSTNYIEIGYNLIHQDIGLEKVKKHTIAKYILNLFGYKKALEGNIKKTIRNHYIVLRHNPFGFNPELRGRYPLTQLLYQYQRISSFKNKNTIKEFQRLEFNLAINVRGMNKTPDFDFINRFNTSITYYISPKFSENGTGSFFFEIGYKGQDDYNIYLEDNFLYTSFGLSLGHKYHKQEK